MILAIAVPIMVQNGITNFVGLLDNIMVGMVGTEQMSGVAIVNQLMFVFNISIFGAISGAGIFSAQFYGSGNHEGVRHTFRFKLIFSVLIIVGEDQDYQTTDQHWEKVLYPCIFTVKRMQQGWLWRWIRDGGTCWS